MRVGDSGLYFKRALVQRGFDTIEDVISEVKKPNSSMLKNIGYCRLIQDLKDKGYLNKKEYRYLRSSHIVRVDFPYLSPFALEESKTVGTSVVHSFMTWIKSMGIDTSYTCVVLLYEIGKLQESTMYCIKNSKCVEEGNFYHRLLQLCSYLLYMKESNLKRYKMIGYIFSGISEKRISNCSGMKADEVQPYLRGIACEIGGVVQLCEAKENIDKCRFNLPKRDLGSFGLSLPVLYRLGELEISSSEELYFAYKLGILENSWLLRPEWYSELLLKVDFLK